MSKEEDVDLVINLDIMYNKVGSLKKIYVNNIEEYDMHDFDRVMNVNVRGVTLGIKYSIHMMIPSKKCIIFTMSITGVLGGLARIKEIIGLMNNIEAKLRKYGITVNFVSPIGLATAMTIKYANGRKSYIMKENMINVK
eukprot:Gb_37732 [translate_table: standard]